MNTAAPPPREERHAAPAARVPDRRPPLSFSRAAEELHLTQPAVSAQVRELEGHAGLPLFERLGKRIHLTAAGAELLVHSRAIVQQFREAEEAMAR
jgi:DNA-binding transcriptional LysR family regulator